jgi:hypothetical protein
MPNEIYHRSNWGESKAEDFGDVYYDHAATNKLYNHSDYYENSDGTDATLKDLNDKASIVLTPTAYSDGSLNTVIPPYQVLPTELVTNGNFETDSDWTKGSGWSISDGKAVRTGADSTALSQSFSALQNKKFRLSFEVSDWTVGHLKGYFYGGGGSDEFFDNTSIGNGSFTFEVTTTINRTNFAFLAYGSFDGSIDNVSVKEIQEADLRVNEQGLVEDVQILSGELVQNGNFEQIGSELVTNGNFETDSDWNKPVGLTISNGVASANNVGSGQQLWQPFSSIGIYKVEFTISNYTIGGVKPIFHGATYTGASSVAANGTYIQYIKVTSTPSRFSFQFQSTTTLDIDNVSVKEVGQNWTFGTGWSMGDGVALFDSSGNAGYLTQSGALEINKKYKLTATVNSGIVSLVGAFYDVEQGAQIQTGVDSIFTVKSANGSLLRLYSHPNNGDAEITDIKVVEITDDTDLPRIDFTDGTGSLLLEPQRTNFITYSEDFSQWGKVHSPVVTDNFITSPDGTQNAAKVVFSGVNSGRVEINSPHSSTNVTQSIYLKTESGTQAVSIGAIGSNLKEVTVTNEWQRFEHTSTGTYPRVLCDDAATTTYQQAVQQ